MNTKHKESTGLTNKILLMGKSKVGKTSMKSIIFNNIKPYTTVSLELTYEVQEVRFKFMDNSLISLNDCGGQNIFFEQYLSIKKKSLFSDVDTLIYVFSITQVADEDYSYYKECLLALKDLSPKARIFVLINKMDLVPKENREVAYSLLKSKIKNLSDKVFDTESESYFIEFYPTSVYEVSIYIAWTNIMSYIRPDNAYSKHLDKLTLSCNVNETILFEKNSLLAIAYFSVKDNFQIEDKIEDFSCLIKNLKLSCMRRQKQFESLFFHTKEYSVIFQEFTEDLYIMMIIRSRDKANLSMIRTNIELYKELCG